MSWGIHVRTLPWTQWNRHGPVAFHMEIESIMAMGTHNTDESSQSSWEALWDAGTQGRKEMVLRQNDFTYVCVSLVQVLL